MAPVHYGARVLSLMLYQPDSHAAGAWASGCRQQLFYYCSCARRIAPRLLRPSKNVYPNIKLLGPVGGGVAESAAAAEPTVLLLFGFDMCAVVLVPFGSLMVQRDQWYTYWGAKKLFFLIRDIDGPAMTAASKVGRS